eukprot:1185923-Prorocentrum_minimum.AAC.2
MFHLHLVVAEARVTAGELPLDRLRSGLHHRLCVPQRRRPAVRLVLCQRAHLQGGKFTAEGGQFTAEGGQFTAKGGQFTAEGRTSPLIWSTTARVTSASVRVFRSTTAAARARASESS